MSLNPGFLIRFTGLAYAAYCQKTLLQNNPIYVQHFVSRMMSKYPVGTEKPPRDVTGMEQGPNLGYEPYWVNVADRTWDNKCSRCPKYFEKYKTVCAVDSTGDVTVNISMCELLKQDCLAGVAYGRSTGIFNDYQGQYFAVADGWARVGIRQYLNAIIQLSTTPDTTGNRYTIHIDGWSGWWDGIFRNDKPLKWWKTDKYRCLNENKYVEFVMHWNTSSGWFLITNRSFHNWTNRFHLNITDPDPFPIKYIAVGGIDGYSGDWIIKGFIVTSLSPCTEGVGAQPLVTSPTEVSLILENPPKVNKAYFGRLHEVGLDKENISFLTREEY